MSFLITNESFGIIGGAVASPFFVSYIEIINIYILLFTEIIERRYAKYSSQIDKK